MASPNVKCPHCPARFDPRRLEYHLQICESDKPYMCDLCPSPKKRFHTQRGLNSHQSSFHTASERGTEYKCRYCEHGTNNMEALMRHESIHPEEGGRGFRTRSRSRSRVGDSLLSAESSSPILSDNGQSFASNSAICGAVVGGFSRIDISTKTGARNFASEEKRSETNPPLAENNQAPRKWADVQPTPTTIRDRDENGKRAIVSSESVVAENQIAPIEHTNNVNNTAASDDTSHPSLDFLQLLQKNSHGNNIAFLNGIVKSQREKNKALRQICRDANFGLNEFDQVENLIQEYEAKYGALSDDAEQEE